MVARHREKCIQLRWIGGCLGLGRCILGGFLCCIDEYFRQYFLCLCVTSLMLCLLVLKFFDFLNEVFFYLCGCIPWRLNGDTAVM